MSSTRCPSRSGPGRFSALSVRPAPARRRSRSRLLGHARRGLSIAGGRVLLEGRDVLTLSASELRHVRGRQIAYVPQDPSSALNPARKVGVQLARGAPGPRRHGATRRRTGSGKCSLRSGSTRAESSCAATRTSSRAASSSASRSRWPSPAGRRSSCSMSRPPVSMSRPSVTCSRPCARCAAPTEWPLSTSATTWRSSPSS